MEIIISPQNFLAEHFRPIISWANLCVFVCVLGSPFLWKIWTGSNIIPNPKFSCFNTIDIIVRYLENSSYAWWRAVEGPRHFVSKYLVIILCVFVCVYLWSTVVAAISLQFYWNFHDMFDWIVTENFCSINELILKSRISLSFCLSTMYKNFKNDYLIHIFYFQK